MVADGQPTPPRAAGIHQGRAACRDLLRQSLVALAPVATSTNAGPRSSREVWLVDSQFDHWPLDDAEVLGALTAWLRQGGRRLQLIGLDFEASARGLPRFTRWRRDWGHALAVHQPADGQLPEASRGLLAAPRWLQWLDAEQSRLRLSDDPAAAALARAQLADFLQRCEPAWPLTTLGL